MDRQHCRQSHIWLGALLILAACSTSNHLRKIEEGDLSKELSPDLAKRFEVKDFSGASPSPSPLPTPAAPEKPGKKKGKKGPAMKEKELAPKEPKEPTVSATPPSMRPSPMPFEEGERLSYDVRYLGVTAATVEVEVGPVKLVNDRRVYELRGHARTQKLFELVYRVDDRIQSYWDYDGLYSHRFSMDLDESKQNRKLIELYDYEKRQSFFWNRIDHVEKGYSEEKRTEDILPWSQDLLSGLYYMRVAPLPVDSSVPFRMPVIVDGRPWESVITYLRTEQIFAGGKNREARVYRVENYSRGELKNKENTLWVSTGERRHVLRIETKVKVGYFAIALDKIL
jgi:hypothetical protein